MGGSRKGEFRACVNTFITFFISGLWHGAAWTYVLWGSIQGLLIALERPLRSKLAKIPHPLRVFSTFILFALLATIFRAENFSQLGIVFSGLLNFSNINIAQISALVLDNSFDFPTAVDIIYLFGLLAVLLFVVLRCKNSKEMLESFRCDSKSLAFTVFLFCFSVIHLSRGSIFIYFNF